jgi:hypothetical protein
VHVDADPVGPVGRLGVAAVELHQPLAQRHRAVLQQGIHSGFQRPGEHRLVHALDQRLLVVEVAVQQRLGDAQPLGQLARLAGEAGLGEIGDGAVEDLPLAVGGGQPLRHARRVRCVPLGGGGLLAFSREWCLLALDAVVGDQLAVLAHVPRQEGAELGLRAEACASTPRPANFSFRSGSAITLTSAAW